MVTRLDERFENLMNCRIERLGESAARSPQQHKPQFLQQAEDRAGGESVQSVLDADLAELASSGYPSPDCLLPSDIEDIVETGTLAPEQEAHLAGCDPCRTLVEVITAGPSTDRLHGFLERLRAATTEPAVETTDAVEDRRHV